MRILLASIWFPVCLPRHFDKWLRRLGCDVKLAGPTFGRYMPWMGGTLMPEAMAVKPDFVYPFNETPTYGEVADRLGGFDMVLSFDAGSVPRDVPDSVLNVAYDCDNHVRDWPQAERFHRFFGSHSWAHNSGKENFRWSPCSCDPEVDRDLGWERHVDVAMVGCVYEHRMDAVKTLLVKNVTVLGGWGFVGAEWNRLYNLCRCALVLSHSHDLSDRFMSNMAQGCVVLADRGITDAERIGARDNVHYMSYGSWWELVEGVQRARVDEWRRYLVANAKALAAKHTWEARCRELLAEVGLCALSS